MTRRDTRRYSSCIHYALHSVCLRVSTLAAALHKTGARQNKRTPTEDKQLVQTAARTHCERRQQTTSSKTAALTEITLEAAANKCQQVSNKVQCVTATFRVAHKTGQRTKLFVATG